VQAAADDAILALVVFATLFGFAATRLPSTQRDAFDRLLHGHGRGHDRGCALDTACGARRRVSLALGVGLHAGLGAAASCCSTWQPCRW